VALLTLRGAARRTFRGRTVRLHAAGSWNVLRPWHPERSAVAADEMTFTVATTVNLIPSGTRFVERSWSGRLPRRGPLRTAANTPLMQGARREFPRIR
jgi:hypothetical protein